MDGCRILLTGGSGFIGTHLVEYLSALNVLILNLDVKAPILKAHRAFWVHGDIMNSKNLESIFSAIKPTHILHLAAKANLDGQSIKDFPENVIGTDNIIACANNCSSIERVVHFSTQYVVQPGTWPKSDSFLFPYTPYGESKAAGELIVRKKCKKPWTILRPTNVWGPYHPAFPKELWRYLRLRLYVHPGINPIIKHYAYIENAVNQTIKLSITKAGLTDGRVFYLTDPPIDNAEWMSAFSIALTGKPVKRISKSLWYILAKLGDAANNINFYFPMSSERLFRLTVNEQLPYKATIRITGPPIVSLQEGVRRSVKWYMDSLNKKQKADCLS